MSLTKERHLELVDPAIVDAIVRQVVQRISDLKNKADGNQSNNSNADDINAKDALKRTPVHYCILNQWDEGAKVLLNRGADRGAVDVYGLTPLEMAMGRGSLTDEDLFGMLAQGQ